MKHALGKTPDSRHNLMATFNRAGRILFTCHPWTWRQRVANVAAVADQAYIELPDSFGQVIEATIPNSGNYRSLSLVSLADIYRLRAQTNASGFGVLHAAFPGWQGQASGEDYPTPRAELWPTPSTDAAPTITLLYMRTWKTIRGADTNAQPDIPVEVEQALVTISRMLALAIEHNTEDQLPDFREIPDVQRLIAEDAQRQPNLGLMRGGVGTRVSRSFDPITGTVDYRP